MYHWLSLHLLWLYIWTNIGVCGVGHVSKPCGGIFTAARGILNTPNFPAPFQTPISCEWVIDRQLFDSTNASIVVYLTQLFLAEGLSFTEYQVYEKQFQLAGKDVHTVDESNIAKVRYIQSFQNYLVIRLSLDTLHGVHLRVLDHFLDVYGFNITYEITTTGPRRDACTMMDCGFTGICYDYYNAFKCMCMPGYEGKHCSLGSSSHCTSITCSNGGTCIHVGATAVKCVCLPNFSGDTCDVQLSETEAPECINCLLACDHQNTQGGCLCTTQNNIKESLLNDGIELTVTMMLTNVPKMKEDVLRNIIVDQISSNLNINHSKIDVIKLSRLQKGHPEAETTLRIIINRKEEKRARFTLGRWVERNYIANLTINPNIPISISSRPLLYLVSVSANVPGEVREGEEFILTCVARGSPDISFRWLKDGEPINITAGTRNKWSRIIKDPHVANQFTALLGVSFAHQMDKGTFTCQASDGYEDQCRKLRIEVLAIPKPRIEPVSLTAHRGDNFTIKCVCFGQFTYSWTKNKELLPVRTHSERYEILFPGGSLLQVSTIERDTIYSCLVQGKAGSAEHSILVSVVDSTVKTCPGERLDNVLWPETAPDTESLQECPKGYYGLGYALRSCVLSSLQGPSWLPPDFSACIRQILREAYVEFQKVHLGYSKKDALNILKNYQRRLEQFPEDNILPGEGAGIVQLITEIVIFIKKLKQADVAKEATLSFLQIVNYLFKIANSFVTLQQVESVQATLKDVLLTENALLNTPGKEFLQEYSSFDVYGVLFPKNAILAKTIRSKQSPYSVTIRTQAEPTKSSENHSSTIYVILYKNMAAFLPKRSSITIDDIGNEYEIINGTVAIWITPSQPLHISVTFNHEILDYNADNNEWTLSCALADVATGGDAWHPELCKTIVLKKTVTQCNCSNSGVVALLMLMNPDSPSSTPVRPVPYAVIIGCIICLSLCLASTIYLLVQWLNRPSSLTFLKLQSSLCGVLTMILFVAAIIIEPYKDVFLAFTSAIACTILLGLSSHLSTLLVIWTEVIPFPGMVSRPSVAAISTSIPIVAVIGNFLVHRTMDLEQSFWWLSYNTVSFCVIITSALLLCSLFAPLYILLIRKISRLQQLRDHNAKLIKKRNGLLQRSSYLFTSQTIMAMGSILFVNYMDDMWAQYAFSLCCVSMGLVNVTCYSLFPDKRMQNLTKTKSKAIKAESNQFFSADTSSPLNFYTKQEAEVESDAMPRISLQAQTVQSFVTEEKLVEEIKYTTFSGKTELNENACELQLYQPIQQTSPKVAVADSILSPDILGDIVENNKECERSQPDGREKDKLDGMLDSITHDLDYLLNRAEEGDPQKPPSASLCVRRTSVKSYSSRTMDLIQEEPDEEVRFPDAVTDILRTSC